MNPNLSYPCPCCGYIVFSEPSGSYDICPVCDWEDDDAQLRSPSLKGGANKMSLIEAQKNFLEFGAKGKEHITHINKLPRNYVKDPQWRIFDEKKDKLKMSIPEYMEIYRHDPRKLYYWYK